MITLITGTPGAGKTLYTISKLLRDLVGSTVQKKQPDGSTVDVPRRMLTNINGLLLDHELIDGSDSGGLRNWQDWCKAGDLIVFDEVQRSWPPRANGSKVPDDISALETHRHRGVDFIVITQHPMLLDRNLRALVGRHLHVRRFGGIGAAIVYEWDHCSNSLMYSKSIAKAPWRYDKSVFELYKSAELHTKPKSRIPTLAFVILAAIAAAAYLVPSTYNRIMSKGDKTEKPKPSNQPGQIQPGQSQPSSTQQLPTRAPVESDNQHTQRIDLSDLILTGVATAGNLTAATWQWVQNGQPRYTFSHHQLTRQPFVIQYLSDCQARVFDTQTKTERLFWCQPGLIPEAQKTKESPSSTSATVAKL